MATDLKWSAVELLSVAERFTQAGNERDAQALRRMIAVSEREENRIQEMVNDFTEGSIVQVDVVPG